MSAVNIQKAPDRDERSLPIFDEMDRMVRQVRERAFAVFAGRGFEPGNELGDWLTAERELRCPAAELIENDRSFGLNVAVAGFEPRDITVTAAPRELIVRAKTKSIRGDKAEARNEKLCWSEICRDDVYRRVELPVDIDVSTVTADFDNGMLKITAPKAQQLPAVAPMSVPVSAAA